MITFVPHMPNSRHRKHSLGPKFLNAPGLFAWARLLAVLLNTLSSIMHDCFTGIIISTAISIAFMRVWYEYLNPMRFQHLSPKIYKTKL